MARRLIGSDDVAVHQSIGGVARERSVNADDVDRGDESDQSRADDDNVSVFVHSASW